MVRWPTPAVALAILVVAGACAVPRPLPTVEAFNGACRGVGLLDARVIGSPSDPRLAWLVYGDTQARRDVIWPPGYTARFTPRLEILDEKGAVVFGDGDQVTGGCVTGPGAQGPLLIAPGL
jgi:hypothetical protein